MGLGLQGAYGLTALREGLRRRLIDEQAAKQRDFMNSIESRRMADAEQRTLQGGEQNRFNAEALAFSRGQTAANNDLTQTEKIDEATPPGFLPQDSPIAGRLQKIGAVTPDPGHLGSTELGGMSALPGPAPMKQGMLQKIPQAAQPPGFMKRPTAKQSDTAEDNARQAAAEARAAEGLTRQQAADAEAARHNKAMEGRPQIGSTVVVQGPNGPEIVDKRAGTSKPVTSADGSAMGQAPTQQQRNTKAQYAKARPILNAISNLSEAINTGQGMAAKATGELEQRKAKLNLNDDIAEYEAMISGFTPLIARALGHTGVLTQQDVDSVKALFPRPGDSKSLRDRKVARIEQLMGAIENPDGGTSGGTMRARDEQGVLHEAPAGTPLPPGWRKEP